MIRGSFYKHQSCTDMIVLICSPVRDFGPYIQVKVEYWCARGFAFNASRERVNINKEDLHKWVKLS
jgi:hypothetical protein